MGSVCCCLRRESLEDYINPNSSVYRNCPCVRCFLQNFLNVYTSVFRREQAYTIPSFSQGTASSSTSLDNSLSDMYHSPPRPLPYDAEPRCLRMQRDAFMSRSEKGTSHSHEDSEPLRSSVDTGSVTLSAGEKWNGSACEEEVKNKDSKIKLKLSASKTTRDWYDYLSPDEEDVCPTCLEDYTEENPKIVTKCSHHFHLGCIYEWMERSNSCPVCGKVMAFDETT